MKRIFTLLTVTLIYQFTMAQAFVTSVEAETALRYGNVKIGLQTSNSSGGYLYGLQDATDKFTVSVTVADTKYYQLGVIYRGLNGNKFQDVYVNGAFYGNVSFPAASTFVETNAGAIFLNAGVNTITIQKSWGYTDFDKFNLYTIPPNVFNITPNLIDPLATDATKKLYDFLVSQFGKRIISGQTDGYYDEVKALTGKSPMLKDYDMQPYSPQYSWNWANGGFAFGANNNSPNTQNAIDWYNSTGKKGIVDFQWHWHSPSGGTVGTNTFYTEFTTFDVTKAIIPGTQEYMDVLRDIDAIAVQLKKLSDAGVPMIWRPLHEAGGTWFWWSAKGPAACKALWNIVYDRITNYNGLHNLIWAWNGNDPDWSPGNSKLDLIGIDSYPGEYNYTINKGEFDKAYHITNGEKIIAMTENGPIPNIDNALNYGAPWSFFMSWYDLVLKQNNNQHIIDVYNNPDVITLENLDAILPLKNLKFDLTKTQDAAIIHWQTSFEEKVKNFEVERSSDGIHFSPIQTIPAKNGTGINEYQYADKDAPANATNYYRIKQTDLNGNITYTRILRLLFDLNGKISIWPNPAKTFIRIQNLPINSRMDMYDATGRLIESSIVTAPEIKKNTTNLAKGTYNLVITEPGKKITAKRFTVL